MTYEQILFDITNGIARLTLNRPDKLNSFTTRMHLELQHAIARCASTPGLRVLLLTGSGRGFCAGQDIAEFAAQTVGTVDLNVTVERFYAPLVLALRALPMPVVCAVNGVAAGAGASLALACDLVVARKSAVFVQAFIQLGLLPDTGGTYFLPRLAGTARAMGLAMLGERLSAPDAADWGLIWKCLEDDAFEPAVEQLVQHLAQAPTAALARIKQAIYSSGEATLADHLSAEGQAMRDLGYTQDHREGVAAFLNKRKPTFNGK